MKSLSVVLLIGVLGNAAAAAAQSFTVGDEVVFSGGPGQGPRSIQTGTSFQATLRGGTPVSCPNAARDKAPDEAREGATKPAPPPYFGEGEIRRYYPSVQAARDAMLEPVQGRRIMAMLYLGCVTDPAQRKDAFVSLQDGLTDQDLAVVRAAAQALGHFGDPAAAPELHKLVSLNDDAAAIAAMHSLAELHYEPALVDLRKIADTDPGPVGEAAKKAIHGIEHPETMKKVPFKGGPLEGAPLVRHPVVGP